jgi:hypothetical protein
MNWFDANPRRIDETSTLMNSPAKSVNPIRRTGTASQANTTPREPFRMLAVSHIEAVRLCARAQLDQAKGTLLKVEPLADGHPILPSCASKWFPKAVAFGNVVSGESHRGHARSNKCGQGARRSGWFLDVRQPKESSRDALV